MQSFQELICPECQNEFKTAALLLQHFAFHAINCLIKSNEKVTSKKIPDLYPIKTLKKSDSDLESDSGVDDPNPMKFCLVTMKDEKVRKYQCKFCFKKFGWPTDLKRHTLIHTGERPFQCQKCDSSFTRNFLLKKHQSRYHNEVQIPGLNPIGSSSKSRKQEKSKIKRVKVEDGGET